MEEKIGLNIELQAMSDIEEITDANLVKTEADKVQWLCEVSSKPFHSEPLVLVW